MKSEIKDLRTIIGNIPVKRVTLEEDETLHEIFIKKGSEAVKDKLAQTIDYEDVFETNNTSLPAKKPAEEIIPIQENTEQTTDSEFETIKNKQLFIETIYNGKLLLRNDLNNYYILGSLTQDLSTLRITLIIEE